VRGVVYSWQDICMASWDCRVKVSKWTPAACSRDRVTAECTELYWWE